MTRQPTHKVELDHADYGWQDWRNAFRVILIVDGDEYEGRGHTMKFAHIVAQARAERIRHEARMAVARKGMSLPGEGGFMFRHTTGQLVEVKP